MSPAGSKGGLRDKRFARKLRELRREELRCKRAQVLRAEPAQVGRVKEVRGERS